MPAAGVGHRPAQRVPDQQRRRHFHGRTTGLAHDAFEIGHRGVRAVRHHETGEPAEGLGGEQPGQRGTLAVAREVDPRQFQRVEQRDRAGLVESVDRLRHDRAQVGVVQSLAHRVEHGCGLPRTREQQHRVPALGAVDANGVGALPDGNLRQFHGYGRYAMRTLPPSLAHRAHRFYGSLHE
ncbi:hypothetical protein BTZ20_2290 [Rhodococcus sp. MTM3W5.2]|nr:hypothetical protein BTZ20_2290 [Rhodococcus sp. MTM3W5.2]